MRALRWSLLALLTACQQEYAEPVRLELEQEAFDTVLTIGALEGEPWEVFARIRSVAVAPGGRFAVLDDRTPMLVLFDEQGRFVDAIAEGGQGPGELGRPWEVRWDESGRLQVLDPSNARISIFDVTESGLAPAGSRPLRTFGEGFCLLGDRVFIGAYRNGGMIHELDADGNAGRTFGTLPRIPSADGLTGFPREVMLELHAPGKFLCDMDEDTILEVGMINSRVQLHEADGSLLWTAELGDLFGLVPVISPDGGVGTREDEETGAHIAAAVLQWDEGHALIQYIHRMPQPDGSARETTQSRLISLETGEELERTGSLPLFSASFGDRFVHVRESPFPAVVVMERR